MRALALAGLVLCACASTAQRPASAASVVNAAPHHSSDPRSARLFGDAERLFLVSTVAPVLADLGNRSSGDLKSLVQRVRVALIPRGEHGGNAATGMCGGEPCIDVDAGYLMEVIHYGDLAAFLAMNRPDGEAQARAFFEAAVQPHQAKSDDGGAAPEFAAKSYLAPQHLAIHEQLQAFVVSDAIAFTILHEVAHQALKPVSDPRQDELQADAWALNRLSELGYSLYFIHRYLCARSAYEWFEQQSEDALPAAFGEHPSFEARLKQLLAAYPNYDAAPQSSPRVLSLEVFGTQPEQTSILTLFLSSEQPEGTPFLAVASTSEGSARFFPGMREGNMFRLYQRVDDLILELAIEDFSSVMVPVQVTQRRRAETSRSARVAIQSNESSRARLQLRGIELAAIMEPKRWPEAMVKVVEGGEIPPAQARRLATVLAIFFERLTENLYAYTSGGIGTEAFAARMNQQMLAIFRDPSLDPAALAKLGEVLSEGFGPVAGAAPSGEQGPDPRLKWLLENLSAPSRPSE